MEDVTLFLDNPWVKHVAESKHMVELLRFLRIGRKVPSILSKLSEIPEEYVMGALEALESLGVVKRLEVSGETFYVLTNKGKILLTYVEDLQKTL